MDMTTKQKLDLFIKIASDLSKNGKTDIKCPMCNTKITEDIENTSSVIHCQTKKCLTFTLRGI